MRRLVAAGADPKTRTQGGATLLIEAARSGQMPVIEYAYSLDDDVLAKTHFGRRVMPAAVNGPSLITTQDAICDVIRFSHGSRRRSRPQDEDSWTAILMADIYPVEKTSMLMYELTLAAGRQPKILPTDLR